MRRASPPNPRVPPGQVRRGRITSGTGNAAPHSSHARAERGWRQLGWYSAPFRATMTIEFPLAAWPPTPKHKAASRTQNNSAELTKPREKHSGIFFEQVAARIAFQRLNK